MNREPVTKCAPCLRGSDGPEGVSQKTLDDHRGCLVGVQSTARQVVKLVVINAGAGGTVYGRNVISQHFQFWNCVGPCALAEQQVSEDLTGIGAVGTHVDDQSSRPDAATASTTSDVGDEGRGGVAHVVMDLNVMVVMTAALAMNGQADPDGTACIVKVVAEVRLPSETSDREGAGFEGRVAADAPIVATHHARFEVKLVGHDHAEMATIGDFPG